MKSQDLITAASPRSGAQFTESPVAFSSSASPAGALVTDSGQGIGLALADGLAAHGAEVILNGCACMVSP